MKPVGKVYLVGAGPGAPDLLTLRAARLLAQADIVFHDALVHAETIALAERAIKVAVGKRCGRHSTAQRFINKRLIDAAHKHAVVVRLKGGDPALFGRLQDELDALHAAGIEAEVVPGVTAATAAAAELGISLSQRGVARGVVMTTPRVGVGEPNSDWSIGLNSADTVVVYMGAGKAHEVMQRLAAQGFDGRTPVVVVENATLPNRKETWCVLDTLGNTAKQSAEGPALIMIGQTLAKARHNVASVVPPDEQIDRFLEYGNSWFR